MTWYYTGCCFSAGSVATPTPTPTPTSVVYTYSSGNITGIDSSGTPGYSVSDPQAVSTGPNVGSVAFNFSADDFVILVPTSAANPTVTYNSGTSTINVTVHTGLVLATNTGWTSSNLHVTDGTHTATFAANLGSGNWLGPALSAAGFTVAASGASVQTGTLQSLGLLDGSGHLTFKVVVVPSGSGLVSITGLTTTPIAEL